FPYMNGQDVNTGPSCSASRWVINFHDWPESLAKRYPNAYEQTRRLVKPDRQSRSETVRRAPWWQYWRRRPGLARAMTGFDQVIVITLVSKTAMPVMVPTGQVFSHALGVFA